MKAALYTLIAVTFCSSLTFAKVQCASAAENFVQEFLQNKSQPSELIAATTTVKVANPNIEGGFEKDQVVHTKSGSFQIECDNDDHDGCGCDPDSIKKLSR